MNHPNKDGNPVGRPGVLQLPCGSGKHATFERISRKRDTILATGTPSPEPKAPAHLGPNTSTS
jgi:hypothetical protein